MKSFDSIINKYGKNLTSKLSLKANYFLNNYNEVVWLIGDGRSGTTWVSDLINHDKNYREMFEPFHPWMVQDANFLVPHQYMRPTTSHKKLIRFASDIFSGKYTNRKVDRNNQSYLYGGILIKDIFANLFAYWAVFHFPKVKPVLLIRNPFSVALSKQKKKKWAWVTEPLDLLNQPDLYDDYLAPHEDLINKTSAENNYILNQVLIWSIINYIPLRQFEPERIHISFYEAVFNNPNQEISKIFEFVKGSRKNCLTSIPEKVIEQPSRVVGKESNILSGSSPVLSWKNELTSKTIDAGMEILQHFGFEDLYDNNSMPKIEVLRKIQYGARLKT